MSRAAVQFQRQPDASWKPVGVWYATPSALRSRFLPATGLDDFEHRVHAGARPPQHDDGTVGTWEDFIEYALDALSNGTDLHIAEVVPDVDVDRTYARDVLGLTGRALTRWRPRTMAMTSVIPAYSLTSRTQPW